MDPNKALPVIGVVGAGTMGSGIALTALYAGAEVYLQDTIPDTLEQAGKYIQKFLEKKGQAERLANLHLVERLDALAPVDIVIEAAPERLDIKQEIFRQLDGVCTPETIFASNTSTLSVTAVAAATAHPGRVAGMHFFNPAPLLPLVEVVRAAQSTPEVVAALVALAEALGKTAVVTGDTPGFIVNRVARPFYGEALRLVGEGAATIEQVDALAEQGAGFRMGPFRLMDLIGIDINAGAMRSMYEQTFGEPRYRPHWLQVQKLASGDLGRKTGKGFYAYDAEAAPQDLPALRAGGGLGSVQLSGGSFAPGLDALCVQAGYVLSSKTEADTAAAFVCAGRAEGARALLSELDASLPAGTPLFIQSADIAYSEAASWVQQPERLVGFDGLFLEGDRVSLTGPQPVRAQAEALFASLGKRVTWLAETPALVLPRLVCQLANEAAFAQLEGVAAGETIDLAMRLGVNYPKGPLAWGAELGWAQVLAVLDHLYAEYHEERYRACVLIRRWARSS